MTSAPPELQPIASPTPAYRLSTLSPASGWAPSLRGECPQLSQRTRRMGALAAVALFVAAFPANINMVRLWKDKPLPMRIGAIARLPLQIPMIAAALNMFRNP
jgi:uncharacterized membrane protein